MAGLFPTPLGAEGRIGHDAWHRGGRPASPGPPVVTAPPSHLPFPVPRILPAPMEAGIVGLPNVGKSTLFNALTMSKAAQSANYPFCTIEPNEGMVSVPDERLTRITKFIPPQKVIPAALKLVDIAGIVKGASEGQGLGNKFLSHIREVDAILQVVRCFEDPDVIHVAGKVDPVSDMETIELELELADIQHLENLLPKAERAAKGADKDAKLKGDVRKKCPAPAGGKGLPAIAQPPASRL